MYVVCMYFQHIGPLKLTGLGFFFPQLNSGGSEEVLKLTRC